MSFGENLRKYRKRKGLSQAALGEQMGLKASIIGRYELNEATPKPERISQFASALDVTPSELLDFEHDCLQSDSEDFFAIRLKIARNTAGLSQKQIASELDISVQTYNGYETKGYEPKYDMLLKICRILKVTPNYILGWDIDVKQYECEFADRLRRFREESNLSQKELAEMVGLTAQSYNNYEKRGYSPTPELLVKLAVALKTTPNRLLDFKI